MDAYQMQVENARGRLKTAYLTRWADNGGYRTMADQLDVNLRYLHEFVERGIVPKNSAALAKLLKGLPEHRPMDELSAHILGVITQHVGAKNAIKKRDLLTLIWGKEVAENESYNNKADRQLRACIESLNRDHGALICSLPSVGYFYAANLSEGLNAAGKSCSRALTQLANAKHLERNLRLTFGRQLNFEEEGAAPSPIISGGEVLYPQRPVSPAVRDLEDDEVPY